MFDFFYGSDSEQYQFYRVPQVLFTDDRFKSISCEAKLLYGFLLDRTSLSKKSKWVDADGKTYVFYKQENAQESLNIGKDKAVKIFVELENIGLIIRKKQGQGKPTKIYVMNFSKPVSKSNTKVLQRIKSLTECKSKNKTSGITSKTAVQTSEKPKSEEKRAEVKTSKKPKSELDCSSTIPKSYIHTEINHTENSNTYPSIYHITETNGKSQPKSENPSSDGLIDRSNPNSEISIYKNAVAETQLQISYMYLLTNHQSKKGYLDLIVSLIAEVYVSAYTHPTTSVIINGIKTSIGIVADRLKTIDESHIEYLFEKIDASANTKQIKNPRSYLLSCLYNAPTTMELDTDLQVAYDLHNSR
jgi:uncharacterized protein YjgD (DUF1641 family)